MDANAKKTALRMIPYGLYVLTAEDGDGTVAAATVNWVTQASFHRRSSPSASRSIPARTRSSRRSSAFALNVLGKGQQAAGLHLLQAREREGDRITGEPFRRGSTGAPILASMPAYVECRLVGTVEKGDHSIFVGEVVDAGVSRRIRGRPDDATLWLKDLGDKIFYGG